ncbi:hypothetical protein CCACVL1_20757 [Corchorus capsularis]|uniref:Uncharacterized protein n=1 Tax=Corchorus capsularis TaxID=210143 RepID=A0A1R3HA67_COCAP|nr:hypothetical protein CCACVL1_20757 [Corchorus capsularis]
MGPWRIGATNQNGVQAITASG